MFGSKNKTKNISSADVYNDIVETMKSRDIKFNEDRDALAVFSVFQGDDLPIKVSVSVEKEMPILKLDALLDFQAPPGSYGDILIGLNDINAHLHFGAFVLEPDDGRVIYRYHYLFAEYRPSKELISLILNTVVNTVDENDGNLKKIIPEYTAYDDPMFR